MKTEDYDQLKKLCDDNGFELVTESPKENDKFFVVKKKDIWDGVEFYEFAEKVYKIDNNETNKYSEKLWSTIGKWVYKIDAKPSTEQAYIEQLKMIANEKYGEIKEGDSFECPTGMSNARLFGNKAWDYIKEYDCFYFYNVELYRQGKWATKLPERIKVTFYQSYMNVGEFRIEWVLNNAKNIYNIENIDQKISEYLTLKLDEYLNNEL